MSIIGVNFAGRRITDKIRHVLMDGVGLGFAFGNISSAGKH